MPVQCRDGNFPAWGGKSAASSPEPVKHPCKGSRGEGAETGARRDAKGKQRLRLSACLIVSVLLSIMAVFNSQFQHLMHCIIFLNVDYQPQFNCFWLGMTRSLLTCQLFSFYQMGRGFALCGSGAIPFILDRTALAATIPWEDERLCSVKASSSRCSQSSSSCKQSTGLPAGLQTVLKLPQ